MVRRFFLWIFMIALCFISTTQADDVTLPTRQDIIYLEGVEETVTTTYLKSSRGYSIWIDANYLVLQPEDEGNNMDVFLRPGMNDIRYQVSICYNNQLGYTFEQAVHDVQQSMTENYGFAEAFDMEGTFTNLPAVGIYANDDDTTILQYVVDAGEGEFYIVIMFPQEAAEGFGSRVIQMLKSFKVLPWDDTDTIE